MRDYMNEFNEWINNPNLEPNLREDLNKIKNNDDEIKERFYQDLSFGTAGLRGKLGAGTNRMNVYVVARATQALANVINSYGKEYANMGVALAHDSRIMSPEFCLMCARILTDNGIKVYMFDALRPTPELSYAIRYYGCCSGINITASHNPKEYNGYKVYWKEGAQIKSEISDKVLEEIQKLPIFPKVELISKEDAIESGLLQIISKDIDEKYYEEVLNTSLRDQDIDKSINIIYTPLYGAGNIPVQTVLFRKGFKNVFVVKEQELPDGTFPTITYPNPEDTAAFEYALKLANKVSGDIIIATDPDCDRVAIQVRHNDEYIALNGNQTAVILLNYILTTLDEQNKIPTNPIVVKSIVTSEMGKAIAEHYGVEMIDVLTGFKNIAEIVNIAEINKDKNYIMGYEESIGYNVGTFVRDKDAVTSSLLLVEACAYYAKKNLTFVDILNSLYEKYGYYKDNTLALTFEGISGQEKIKQIMENFRVSYPKTLAGANLVSITDYLNSTVLDLNTNETSTIDMEKTDAIKFLYSDECWFTLRPSGTEPKIKIYIYVKADTNELANKKLKEIEIILHQLIAK